MKKIYLIMLSFVLAKDHIFSELNLDFQINIQQEDKVDNIYFDSLNIAPTGQININNPNNVPDAKAIIHVKQDAVIFGKIISEGTSLEIISQANIFIDSAIITAKALNIKANKELTISHSSLVTKEDFAHIPGAASACGTSSTIAPSIAFEDKNHLRLSATYVYLNDVDIKFNSLCVHGNYNPIVSGIATTEKDKQFLRPFTKPELIDPAVPTEHLVARSSLTIENCDFHVKNISLNANSICVDRCKFIEEVEDCSMGSDGCLFDVIIIGGIAPSVNLNALGGIYTSKAHLPGGEFPKHYYYNCEEVAATTSPEDIERAMYLYELDRLNTAIGINLKSLKDLPSFYEIFPTLRLDEGLTHADAVGHYIESGTEFKATDVESAQSMMDTLQKIIDYCGS